MRKYSLLIMLLLPINFLYSQNKGDTVFLKRELNANGYKAVFVQQPRSDFHYRTLKLLSIDSLRFNEVLKEMDRIIANKVVKVDKGLQGEWISVFFYRNRWYAYSPSEPYYNLYLSIQGTTVSFNDFNEGITPSVVTESKRDKSGKILSYTLTDVNENTNHISLQFLDEEKSWMRVKFHDANSRSVVMVKKQVFFKLPIIVNFCPASRCTEWNFDPNEKLGLNKIQAIPQ